MIRYAIRRIWQAAPTVFGVALVTFVLFHVVGGSPALQVLGQHASPAAIEDYNDVRGYNKPLFWGRYVGTEALRPESFERLTGAWAAWDGAAHDPVEGDAGSGSARLAADEPSEFAFPFAFELRPGTTYRLRAAARVEGGTWRLVVRGASPAAATIGPGPWAVREVEFTVPPADASSGGGARDVGAASVVLEGASGTLWLDDVRLERRVERPWDSQFLFYLGQIATFNFGTSHETHQSVSRLVADGILPSLSLTVPMFLVGVATAVAVSLVCAFWRGRWPDRFFLLVSVALMSVNYLVYIIVAQYLLAFRAGLFPIWGFETPYHLVLPVIIGVVSGLGGNVRFYRTVMLDEVNQDYVRTARAKGCGQGRVMFVHVLRNAMIPILTQVVVALPFLYTGSLLLENFFGIPGLGHLAYNAIQSADFDVIKAYTFVGSLLFVAANLITDLLYAVVDPRVRLR